MDGSKAVMKSGRDKQSTILIVDDDESTRITLEAILLREGYNLVFAHDGVEALTKAKDLMPDLVLLDVMMPGMSGLEVCEALRADDLLSVIPVVMVTALDDRDSRLRALDVGADDFLSKPVDVPELRARVRTITRLNRYHRLLAEQAKFEHLVELSPEGIAVVRAQGFIQLVNPALLELLGAKEREKILKKNLLDFVVSEDRETTVDFLDSVVEGESHRHFETALVCLDGRRIQVELDGGYFLWEDHPSAQVIVRDITERKRAEAALASQTRALARANEELRRLIYVASHHLREPVRMMTMYTQLLLRRYRDKFNGEAEDLITFVVDGAARIKRLLDALVTYLEVDNQRGTFAPVDCEALLEHVLAQLQPQVASSNAVITHTPLPVLRGDRGQLARLFEHVVDNAIKFQGDFPPRVHISVIQEQEKEWHFRVRDNGIGISPQHVQRLFVVFERLHRWEEYPGTGIGLAICKKIVARHGGRIWIESPPEEDEAEDGLHAGVGTVIHFTILA